MSQSSRSRSLVARALLLVPMVAIAACSDGVSPSASSIVSLSFRVSPASSGASASRSALFDGTPSTPSTPAGDTVAITKVQLVLSHIQLSQLDSACAEPDDADDESTETQPHSGCDEVKLAPMLVDIPLTAGETPAITAPVPPGTYRNLHARLAALTADSHQQGAADFIAANPDFSGISMRIEGTYGSTPFVYTTDARAQIYVPFRPPLDLSSSTTPSVTIAVDPSGWFRTADGTWIDPTTVGMGQPNNRYIAANIRRSFRGFRDDDHDGRGDHGGEGQH